MVNEAQGLSSIFEYLSQQPRLSSIVRLIVAAGLQTQFSQPGRYTLFAPTNEAIAKFLADVGLSLEQAGRKPQLVSSVLGAHLVNKPISYGTVACNGGQVVYTVTYQRLVLDVVPERDRRLIPVVETSTRQGHREARVIGTDLLCSNGFVQVIDEVLV